MSEFSVSLNASEAMRLDGHCRPEVQVVVERARDTLALAGSGLVEKQAAMVARIVATAREKGRLTFTRTLITSCPCCGRRDGYHVYPRAGRYHRKGAPNFSKPKTFMGYDLDRGFVSVQHHISVGFCETCRPQVEPVLVPLLAKVQVDCPTYWEAAPHRWVRHENKVCTACGWEGHEGEMRQALTLMGDGFYPAGCPSCDAENRPLTRPVIERRDGFTLVERPTPNKEA